MMSRTRITIPSILRFIAFGALMGAILLNGVAAAAADAGTVQGRVVNKTPGGPLVADLKVTLKAYVNGAEKSSKDATSDKDGKFIFTGVPTETTTSYVVSASYQEADYSSNQVSFGKGETVLNVDLPVWEATADGSTVSIQATHMIFYLDEGGLRVEEYVKVSNSADRTYVGSEVVPGVGRKKTLTFTFPENASGFQSIDGLMDCCIQKTSDGFYDTMAVPPEKGREIVFGYRLDYDKESYTVKAPVNLRTKSFNVFVPDSGGIQIESDLLKPRGPIAGNGGATYKTYVAEELSPGTNVTFTLSGLPKPKMKVNLKLISLISGILIVGLAVSYPLFRRRKLAPAHVGASPQAEREYLLAEIAKLDDDFESGRIKEQHYRRVRSLKKARLAEVTRRLGRR